MGGLTKALSMISSLSVTIRPAGNLKEGTGDVQMYLVHELLARILVAYTDAVTTVVTGVELARVDLDDGEVLGVLTGFGGR